MKKAQIKKTKYSHHSFFIIKKILSLVFKSFLISVAMLPVFLSFKLNPYLSNEVYANRPQETMHNLLVTSIPMCLVLHFLCMILHEASIFEGRQDLRGTVISVSKALLMLLTQYWLYVIVVMEVVVFRALIMLCNHFLSLQELQSMRMYLLALVIALSFEVIVFTYNSGNLLSTTAKRTASKPLPAESTIVNRFGIIRKKAKQAKGFYKYLNVRRLKMSLYASAPFVLCEGLLYLISFTTIAINSPSQLVVGFYCASLVALKILLQTFMRTFLSYGNSGGHHFATTLILGCTVTTDSVIRIICSQISSPAKLALMLTLLGVGEIIVRCYCIFRAISRCQNIQETTICSNTMGCQLREQKKSENDIVLFLVEVDADIISEYVAINTSFMLKHLFSKFDGFVVGSNATFDTIRQLKYVALQYSVEIFVDIISCSIESYHPKIREVIKRQPKLTSMGNLATSCQIGMLCSSVLIVLLIY